MKLIEMQSGWHGFGVWKHDRKLDYHTGHLFMTLATGFCAITIMWYYYFPDVK